MVESSIVMFAAGVVILGLSLAVVSQVGSWGAASREATLLRGTVKAVIDAVNLACVMDIGSTDYFTPEALAGSSLRFSGGRLCATKGDSIECEKPNCAVEDYALDLDTPFYSSLKAVSASVELKCSVETTAIGVRFSCS